MNDLTVALTCLGGVVLVGVVAHGAWQARKAGPMKPVQMPPAEQREPVLVDSQATPVSADEAPGPPASDVPQTDDQAPIVIVPALRRPMVRIDALVDAIALIGVESPTAGDLALAHLPATRRAGSKPFLIEGLNSESRDWEMPVAGQRYSEFQAGVQLANRTGALNEIEYSEFVQKVQTFAESIGAMVDFPDMLDVVARARELDAFASAHDAQLAVRLYAKSAAWSVGYIQQHASRSGFVPGLVSGRLVLPSTEDGAPPVLTLSYDPQAALADDPGQAAVRDVTLSFDVPQTAAAGEPFSAWRESADALAASMDAIIVDDNGQTLTVSAFDSIGRELRQLYEALEARDLAAGSMVARKLFS